MSGSRKKPKGVGLDRRGEGKLQLIAGRQRAATARPRPISTLQQAGEIAIVAKEGKGAKRHSVLRSIPVLLVVCLLKLFLARSREGHADREVTCGAPAKKGESGWEENIYYPSPKET